MKSRKLLSVLLALLMVISLTVPTLAADPQGSPPPDDPPAASEGATAAEPAAEPAPADDAAPAAEASFELIENIKFQYEGYKYPEKNSFYLYSPSTPHSFDLLSSFMNGVIFVYPDKPYTDKDTALADLQRLGLIDIAESCPAYIIVAIPANGESWSEADVDMYYLSQYYLAGGYFDIKNGVGMNPMETEFTRHTMNTLQYVIAEGAGATFANNYLSQNAGRIAGQLLFGGEITKDLAAGLAVPSYLVGASEDAVAYWKNANGTDSEADSGTFVNSGYVQKKVIVAESGAAFDKDTITTAWADLLSRTTRLCITTNLVLRSIEKGDWVLMDWPNYKELGVTRVSRVFDAETGASEPYSEYKSVPGSVHTFIPDSVAKNPDTAVPLVIVLHGSMDDPLNVVNGCGWINKAAEEGFIVVSPDQEDPDYLTALLEYTKTQYNIDSSRVYLTGFSMGGMNTATSAYIYPELYAAIAPMGATGVTFAPETNNAEYADRAVDSAGYDIPACVIIGSIDEANAKFNEDGSHYLGGIVDGALEKIFAVNEISLGEKDYAKTADWGYAPDKQYSLTDKGSEWVFHDFYKEGYEAPFVELVTITGADHANNDYMATAAWDFMSKYSRADDGSVVEGIVSAVNLFPFTDVQPSDSCYAAVKVAYDAGLVVGREPDKFFPNADMSVGEYLTAIYRLGFAAGLYPEQETTGADWRNGAAFMLTELKLDYADLNASLTHDDLDAITGAYLDATGLEYQPGEATGNVLRSEAAVILADLLN